MYDFICGEVVEIYSNRIIIENNGIGYSVFCPNPYVFKEEEQSKVFLYNHLREDENSLYGFKSKEERELFLKLINVKGLGPKVALPILATGTVSGVADAIDRENILYLTKFPKIGEKLARQIILDLKGKLIKTEDLKVENDELVSVLLSLGYKTPDIKKILPSINSRNTIEEQVKEALKMLLK